jgi:predicted secreted protein
MSISRFVVLFALVLCSGLVPVASADTNFVEFTKHPQGAVGDYDMLDVIGFSPDGRYMAFEVYGFHDGLGNPYSAIRILDIPKNRYVHTESNAYTEKEMQKLGLLEAGDRAAAHLRSRLRQEVQEALKQYKIDESIKGKLIWYRSDEDKTKYSGLPTVQLHYFDKKKKDWDVSEVKIKIQSIKAAKNKCPNYMGIDSNMADGLKLSLDVDGKKHIAQFDKSVPQSRGSCPTSYGLVRVYQYNNGLVFFLTFHDYGFEGSHIKLMAVSWAP